MGARNHSAGRLPHRGPDGNQAVDTLFYNAHDYADRYSAQDTIREQGNIYLTTGHAADVDAAAHVLLTITADTCGRHDTLGGACANESNMVRYAIEKRHMHACRSSFLKGLMDWGRGMEKRDITSNINFFMNVPVTPEGETDFRRRHFRARANTWRCARRSDVLAAISNCPQLNNPCNAYNPTPVQVLIWDAAEHDVPQGPDCQPRRDRLPHHSHTAAHGSRRRWRSIRKRTVHSLHVRQADEAVAIGPAPAAQSYLSAERICWMRRGADRRGGDPSGLRFPERERGVRAKPAKRAALYSSARRRSRCGCSG